jgi:16S rRNA (guanine(966)-N(2))-methyltransferase RsmD
VAKRRRTERRRDDFQALESSDQPERESDERKGATDERTPVGVRIIGGKHRGRTLQYSGDMRTRPMKDRVREAVFNLVGPGVKGMHAIDLFAGTGALGLEAVSRGASGVTLIERHLPTTKIIQQNAAVIGVEAQTNVIFGDAFRWAKNPTAPTDTRWVVFCCPPYEFYVSRQQDMLELVTRLMEKAPVGSLIVVEADEQFDMSLLPGGDIWDVRKYFPAFVAIATKEEPK